MLLSAATKIDDPKAFVTEVYKQLMAKSSYEPPTDIYTPRLAKLFREDEKRAKGEVGCLEFNFWVNGQDFKISRLAITSEEPGPDRKTVIAKFRNIDRREEIHFDFRRNAGRWMLDDVHSLLGDKWTLSQILKCAP
ncbi:MAG TPA: hypothetical protein VMB25_10525 [Bryobacteraceae bacterium]|nr:hypothetical protein [Bryobacteraceae bacterium]